MDKYDRQKYLETAKEFPDLSVNVGLLLAKKLPLLLYGVLKKNLDEHSLKITHELVQDCITDNLDEFNGIDNSQTVKRLVSEKVTFEVVDKKVSDYVQWLFFLQKSITKK